MSRINENRQDIYDFMRLNQFCYCRHYKLSERFLCFRGLMNKCFFMLLTYPLGTQGKNLTPLG